MQNLAMPHTQQHMLCEVMSRVRSKCSNYYCSEALKADNESC